MIIRKSFLAAVVSLAAVGYSHGRTETVTVKRKGEKGTVRVNKSDFDADQADDGAKTMTLAKATEAEADTPGDAVAGGAMSDVNVTGAGGVVTTAAPSAPNMSGPEGTQPPIDEVKNAAAPAVTGAEQLLVMKQGKKFYIADGLGQKITGDRAKLLEIDEDGYDTEAAAKAVQSRTEPSKASGT